MRTLTRSDLADKLCSAGDVDRFQAVDIIESILGVLAKGLKEDGHVKLSSFGTMQVLQKTERVGRNPKTGQEVKIHPRLSISFKASQTLKKKVSAQKV